MIVRDWGEGQGKVWGLVGLTRHVLVAWWGVWSGSGFDALGEVWRGVRSGGRRRPLNAEK